MAGHDLSALEGALRSIAEYNAELLKIIHMKGYTTPRELALVTGVSGGIAAQMKTLVVVSREIVAQAR